MKTWQTFPKLLLVALLLGVAGLAIAQPVWAVPFITPSGPSYRGINRGLVQDRAVVDEAAGIDIWQWERVARLELCLRALEARR